MLQNWTTSRIVAARRKDQNTIMSRNAGSEYLAGSLVSAHQPSDPVSVSPQPQPEEAGFTLRLRASSHHKAKPGTNKGPQRGKPKGSRVWKESSQQKKRAHSQVTVKPLHTDFAVKRQRKEKKKQVQELEQEHKEKIAEKKRAERRKAEQRAALREDNERRERLANAAMIKPSKIKKMSRKQLRNILKSTFSSLRENAFVLVRHCAITPYYCSDILLSHGILLNIVLSCPEPRHADSLLQMIYHSKKASNFDITATF
eukprot:g3725.t1